MSRPVLGRTLAAALLAAVAVAEQRIGLALAVVLLLVVATTVAAAARPSWALVVLAAGLAVQPVLRDAGWVLAVTVPACLVACAAVARRPADWRALRALPATPVRWLRGTALVGRATRALLPATPPAIGPVLRGLALAALLLVTFGGLLVAADGAFAELVDGIAAVDVRTDVLVARIVWGVAVLATCGALAHAAARGRVHGPAQAGWAPGTIELRIGLAALTSLFAAFVAVQLQVLFGGADYVRETTGLGYGDYARQGFVQLLLAAGLTLAVVGIAARRRDPAVRGLLGVIGALVLVMLVSAHHRLDLVEEAYGFTRVRYGGHAVVLWLAAVIALVLATGASRRLARHAPRAALLLSLGGVLAFSLSNPDGRIADRAVDRARDGGTVDLAYLGGLSADALPALLRLPASQRAVVEPRLRADLRRTDGLAGFNLARSRAR